MSFATDIRISFRNLGRNPKRTAMGLGAILIAQLTVLLITGFMNGYGNMAFNTITGPMLGHIQIHKPGYRKDHEAWQTVNQLPKVMEQIRDIPGVSYASARVYAPVLAALNENGETATAMGVELDKEMQAQGLLESLRPEERPEAGQVLVGSGFADEMGIKTGDTLALVGQGADGAPASGLFRVKATITTAVDMINRKGIIMSLPAAQSFLGLPDQAHEITIRTSDPSIIQDLVAKLSLVPALKGAEILPWQTLQPQLAGLIQYSDKINILILVLVFLTTAAGIANTMLMAAFERSHEFGVLLSIGCRPRRLIRILFYESICLGLSGVVLGSLLGLAAVAYLSVHGISFGGGFELEGISMRTIIPYLKPLDIIRSVIGVAITALLASWWPARQIAKLDPLEAMRQ